MEERKERMRQAKRTDASILGITDDDFKASSLVPVSRFSHHASDVGRLHKLSSTFDGVYLRETQALQRIAEI